MEYVYSAMVLHKVGKSITGASLTKVLTSAGVKPDESRVKALVAALKGIDIEEALKAAPVAVAAPAGAAAKPKERTKPKEEEKPKEEVTGLGALFG